MMKKILFIALLLCWNPAHLFAFTFDNWHSGMTLDEVLDISEKIDLAIKRDGLVGTKEHFDPEVSRAHADKARTFYYKTTLVNEPAKVFLHFTEESRLLFEVKITWHVKKGLLKAVEQMLWKKYSNPVKSRKMFSKEKVWHLDNDNKLVMKNAGIVLHLRYIDLILEKTANKEKNGTIQMKRKEGIKKDQSKF